MSMGMMGEKRIMGIAAIACVATLRHAMAIMRRRIMRRVKRRATPATPAMT